nr:MAG TPA_asm: hypothetical protein [Caudoviricetes sp.]
MNGCFSETSRAFYPALHNAFFGRKRLTVYLTGSGLPYRLLTECNNAPSLHYFRRNKAETILSSRPLYGLL